MDLDHKDLTQFTIKQAVGPLEDKEIYCVGQYQLGRYQRKDSFGYSYEARKFRSVLPEHLGEVFIIKKVSCNSNPSLNRLLYESQITVLSYLKHSNIAINYVSHWKADNSFYIVFQRNILGNLSQFADYLGNKGQTLADDQIIFFLREILLANQALHARKIVHRNLKLENISLGDQLTIKLSDFSLASALGSRQLQQLQFGTPNYLPPEKWLQEHEENVQSEQSECLGDVWAIGVIIYYLTFNQYPLNLRKIKTRQDIIISFANKKIKRNPQLLQLLQCMLQVDSSKRLPIKQLLQSQLLQSFPKKKPSVKEMIMDKYRSYFEERKVQRSTWRYHIDKARLKVPHNVISILSKQQKVMIIKLIRNKFGYFMLLSNLRFIAYFNNGNKIVLQNKFLTNPKTNQQRILVWTYQQYFAQFIKQNIGKNNNLIFEQRDCSLKKLIVIRGSLVTRLTNQTIQVFLTKKGLDQTAQAFFTTISINYNRQYPDIVKVSKEKKIQVYQNLKEGREKQNKYCQYVGQVFQAIIGNSLLSNQQ